MIEHFDHTTISRTARKILGELIHGQPQSIRHLSNEFQCSPRFILAAIELLQSCGCILEFGTDGVRLCQTHWSWWRGVLEDISAQRGTALGRNVLVYGSISSTNDVCRQAASQAGRPIGETLVVLADQQSAGRGRHGHRWESRGGQSLLMSILFPADQHLNPETITLCAAIACATCVESFAQQSVSLKWPNDVLVVGRKTAGILVETIPAGDHAKSASRQHPAVILGIGINVAQAAKDFPPELQDKAGSLYIASGRQVDRLALAVELLGQIERCCMPAISPDKIALEWKNRCNLVNRMVRLTHRGVQLHGRVTDLDPSVGLVITDANGRTHFADAAATNLVET